ncbi:MAG: SdiA-regulated domain-containing protein [Pseudomonadota bacterium]
MRNTSRLPCPFFSPLVFSLLLSASSIEAAGATLEAALLNIKQIHPAYRSDYRGREAINLSGLAQFENTVFALGDKPADQCLYALQEEERYWRIDGCVSLEIDGRADLEGVFAVGREFFLVNEAGQDVYRFLFSGRSASKEPLRIRFPWVAATALWRNAGLEGVAYDARQHLLYLAKERDPSVIYVFELDEEGQATYLREFSIEPAADAHPHQSISDLFFADGFLYALERRAYSIAKVNPRTGAVVSRASFAQLRDASGALYLDDKGYGLAEAMLLLEKEILLGIDNNGKITNPKNKWVKQFSLSGDESSIIRLRRPVDF